MYKLGNPLRAYDWGSPTAIAELLGRTPSGGPEAEVWIGAHPDSPSRVSDGRDAGVPLNELINRDPLHFLGAHAHVSFGNRLPFLMKLLAARSPLSLQVHPSLDQARAGYDAENASSIPQNAPHRNYRDASHKPEMILALSEFDALCGFRSPGDASKIFTQLIQRITERDGETPSILQHVIADLAIPNEALALRTAFARILTGGAETRATIDVTLDLLHDSPPKSGAKALPSSVASTVLQLNNHFPGDPGVLVALLMNQVALKPGQALYLPAGTVHAYLRGLGIEVMASSDNVLRGGLTSKHVDVRELLDVMDFASFERPLVAAERTATGEELYRPPFHEFQLQRIELPGNQPGETITNQVALAQNGPAIVITLNGTLLLQAPQEELLLPRGESAFVAAHESPVTVVNQSHTAGALAFAVTAGATQKE